MLALPTAPLARHLVLPTLLLSLAVIGGALAFQYIGELAPCELCLLERWPWYGMIILCALMLAIGRKLSILPASLLIAVVFLGSAGLGFYHVGVENHFLPGPTACTAQSMVGLSAAERIARLKALPVVQCDVIQWSLFGISLAGWNMLASLLPVILAARLIRTRKTGS